MFEVLKMELELRGYSKKTIKSYLYYNFDFIDFIKKRPNYVSVSDIKKYLIYNINKKPRTINLIISSLKFYYDIICKKRLFKYIKRMKQEKNIPLVISRENIKQMIDMTHNLKHKILIELLYGSGLRVGECVKLKITDLNLNEGYGIIRQGKGKKDRYIILSGKFVYDFRNYFNKRKDDNHYIFNTSKGHYSIRTAEVIVNNAARKIGLNVFPHALRSSFATHLIDNNVHISKIQKLLGHSKRQTTENYIKTSTKDLKEISSPLDL